MKRIAAITMARNDEFFLNRWIVYYGAQLGPENLYIYLDGEEQKTPARARGVNVTKLPHLEQSRARGDKRRIRLLSDLARDLFKQGYDIVIGCDCDEFLVVDPNTEYDLAQYLSDLKIRGSVSGLGLDVGQDLNSEYELDAKKPFLEQRNYALLSTRYTKPVVLAKPLRWGSGFHSVKRHNFHINKNLYLLHFGSVDHNMLRGKVDSRNPSWKKHLSRRAKTIYVITKKKKRNASLKLSRLTQTLIRPIYAWNKPAMFGQKKVIKIPERFKAIGV